ncbi:signal peptide peptidase SppA [bacterium]|nr:MAG: signal peptide peptidase SppA [bacterium]
MRFIFKVLFWVMAIVGILATISHFSGSEPPPLGDRVGVLKVSGFIADAEESVKALDYFRENSDVKAVIVRVISPGGVIAPSQEIRDAVKRTAEAKPVIASFGAVAASGGYYLSAPATRIIADPGSITGSIGVIMQFPEYEVLLDKIGMRTRTLKSGPFKDTGSPMRQMTDAEKAVMQSVVDDLFAQFVDVVAEGRKMDRAKVLALADGRIYSGRQALGLGLVDELGGFDAAVRAAGTLAGLGENPRLERWKRKRDGVLPLLLGSEDADAVGNVAAPLTASPARYLLSGW